MRPRVLAGIFARGGSKGVPRKNLRPLAGKPLIAHAIDVARRSRLVSRVVVSTDDPEIAAVARANGAEVPFMRPVELALDDAPEWAAWQHALRTVGDPAPGVPWDAFVCIPPTSPLRTVEDVDACVQRLLDGSADIVIAVTPAARSPYFNMVTLDATGAAHLVIRPAAAVVRRQDAPQIYDMTTVAYAARPEFVLTSSSMFEGRVAAVVVPNERAIDIDTELDFAVAEFLLTSMAAKPQ